MPRRIVQVDAFTDRPFAGNPAAVCVLPEAADPAWMQDVAAEMNLAETAFLVPEGDLFHLRWFTPTVEVDLCGHATIASAHVLWEDGHLGPGSVARFRTRSGLLTATLEGSWITLDFPATPVERAVDPGPIARALGLPVSFAGATRFDVLAEVGSEADLRSMTPDIARVAEIPARGLIVTARAGAESESAGFDFVSRFFGPRVGIAEDPVTGSAHSALGPYWAGRLGRPGLVAYQASRRGGVVRVRSVGDRVEIGGQAVTVLRGELIGRASGP